MHSGAGANDTTLTSILLTYCPINININAPFISIKLNEPPYGFP